jgi:hypothetical protein
MRSIYESLGLIRAPVRAFLILCSVLAAASSINAARTTLPPSQVSSTGFTSNFAIADFDGDRKPDLAIVEIQKGTSATRTQYSIRLQLTVGAAQIFGVTAPAGGLQIMAKDVNGDDALDVVVSTAWQHKQVAVLLNDGHGKFTLADPAAFPAAVWGSGEDWTSGALPLCDSTVLVRIEYPGDELDRESKFDDPQVQFGSTVPVVSAGQSRIPLFSPLGRAPPSLVFQS